MFIRRKQIFNNFRHITVLPSGGPLSNYHSALKMVHCIVNEASTQQEQHQDSTHIWVSRYFWMTPNVYWGM
jgi:hypothetical protein